MICEKCNKEHDGTYASGRFCSSKCARSFSALVKREETNVKVSKTIKRLYKEGIIKPRHIKVTPAGIQKRKETIKRKLDTFSWIELPYPEKRRRILQEQNNCCYYCGISQWLEQKIRLELHHIDGTKNNQRSNLCILCMNCHSQTDNYKYKNRKDIPSIRKTKRDRSKSVLFVDILELQDNRCPRCGIKDWMMKPIKFDLHHIDGNRGNNSRNNLMFLCPNCHSQTPNFGINISKSTKLINLPNV